MYHALVRLTYSGAIAELDLAGIIERQRKAPNIPGGVVSIRADVRN